ncbi:MAG: hypothetical protein OEM52_01575 [bacterium]|nr:hypothetical protein [bacterium]
MDLYSKHQPFKQCRVCQHCWNELSDLVKDRSLDIAGYQASFKSVEEGLILFTHLDENCHSTLAVKAGELKQLYQGTTFLVRNTGKVSCEGRCLNSNDIEPCAAECDMRWVREVLQILRSHELPDNLVEV